MPGSAESGSEHEMSCDASDRWDKSAALLSEAEALLCSAAFALHQAMITYSDRSCLA